MKIADRILYFESPNVKVLQFTDMQIIDSSQCRYDGRLTDIEMNLWSREKLWEKCLKEMQDIIIATKPDMILITGDLVYDEFDDSGEIWDIFVSFMESFGIPWAPVFGNHDKGSKIGMEYKINSLISAKHCLFCDGDTVGNGNYTVAFMVNEKIFRLLYLLDSGGSGIVEKQLKWMNDRAKLVKDQYRVLPKSSICFHIPTIEFKKAASKYADVANANGNDYCFEINKDVPGEKTDFGAQREKIKGVYVPPSYKGISFVDILKKLNIDSVFAGHSHLVNTSICYEGIRWTMGLKTGEYDRFTPGETGGTLINFFENEISVTHILKSKCEENL